jgi:hypothetical protein
VFINDDPDVRTALLQFGELCRIGLPRNRPISGLIVANIERANTTRDQLKIPLMPHPLPSIKERSYL